MKTKGQLSNKEYEELCLEYAQDPPKLSGQPGFLTSLREKALVSELLPPDYARVVNTKAKAMSLSPAEVIKYAIKAQLIENA